LFSHQQVQALPILEWLLSEDDEMRRSGRTTVQAFAYLRHACFRARGRWIRPYELGAFNGRRADEHLMRAIHSLAVGLRIPIEQRQRDGGEFRVGTIPLEAEIALNDIQEGVPPELVRPEMFEELSAGQSMFGSELEFFTQRLTAALGVPRELLDQVMQKEVPRAIPKEGPRVPGPSIWERLLDDDAV